MAAPSTQPPLLRFGTSALVIGVLALVLKGFDVFSQWQYNHNANLLLLFLNTGDGVGGTDMGRLVPLWGTLLIPVGLVAIGIHALTRRSQPQQIGQPTQQASGQQQAPSWQHTSQPAPPAGAGYEVPPTQAPLAQAPQAQYPQPQHPQAQDPQAQTPPAQPTAWPGDAEPCQPRQGA